MNVKYNQDGTLNPEYRAWSAMKNRCYNKNYEGYARYGGRGIKVCERWLHNFPAFVADVGRRPGRGYSLDRYPNGNGNYEPGNVRWATAKEQANNKPLLGNGPGLYRRWLWEVHSETVG